MSHITYIVPEEATLREVSEQAAAKHLHIISNGQRTVLSPTIPAGWHRLIVMVRSKSHARLARQA